MFRVFLLAGITVFALMGCNPSLDPTSDRLKPGQIVMAKGSSSTSDIIVFKSKDARPAGPLAEPGLSTIAVGSRMRIISDDDTPNSINERDVTVYAMEGLQEGIKGTVYRSTIIPID